MHTITFGGVELAGVEFQLETKVPDLSLSREKPDELLVLEGAKDLPNALSIAMIDDSHQLAETSFDSTTIATEETFPPDTKTHASDK